MRFFSKPKRPFRNTARASLVKDMVTLEECGVAQGHRGGCGSIYEILGNSEPELHAHLFPRYASEPDELPHQTGMVLRLEERCAVLRSAARPPLRARVAAGTR
jgi:hypothetical protein